MNREALQQRYDEARQAWQRLAPRERRVLRVAALVLPPLLLWFALVDPALQRIDHWQAELPRLRAQAQTLETVLAEAGVGQALPPGEADARLRETLGRAGLTEHVRLGGEPGRWQVQLDGAPAPVLMEWLLGGLPSVPVRVREVRLRRDGERDGEAAEGRLTGVIELDRAPGTGEGS